MTQDAVKHFYQTLQDLRLDRSNAHATLTASSDAYLLDVRRAVHEAMSDLHERQATSRFSFVANGRLGGQPEPCSMLECRLEHIERLARFAALYADRVLVLSPLQTFSEEDATADTLRGTADDIELVHSMRPMLEAGLVRFYSREWSFCEHCKRRVLDEPRVLDKVAQARSMINELYAERVKATVQRATPQETAALRGAKWVFRFRGPENLVDHGILMAFSLGLPSELLSKVSGDQETEIDMQDVLRLGLFSQPETIPQDLFVQSLYSQFGYSYLTDRDADMQIARGIDQSAFSDATTALEGLTHSVPAAFRISPDDLIRLRRTEGEAFQVYRDRLRELIVDIREGGLRSREDLAREFANRIEPELNKIDVTIRREAEKARISLAADAMALGVLSVAFFGGMVPVGAVSALISLGGFAIGGHTVHSLTTLIADNEARKSDFFFLWKLRQSIS